MRIGPRVGEDAEQPYRNPRFFWQDGSPVVYDQFRENSSLGEEYQSTTLFFHVVKLFYATRYN